MPTTTFNIYVSLISAIFYMAHFITIHKEFPELTDVISIIISSIAAAMGLELLYVVLINPPEEGLGFLEKYKVVIVLGAIALIWVSFKSIAIKYKNRSHSKRKVAPR